MTIASNWSVTIPVDRRGVGAATVNGEVKEWYGSYESVWGHGRISCAE